MNGKLESNKIFNKLEKKTTKGIALAVILIGKDKSSQTYVNIKEKKAKLLDVGFKKIQFNSSVSQKKVIDTITKLNKDKKISGILIQLPLPKKFNTEKILQHIDLNKDVDGLLFNQGSKFVPPTTQAILHLIKISKIKLTNKKAVILCNSEEFANTTKTILQKNKVKTYIKLKPKNNISLTQYNIVIVALGKKYFIKPKMIKNNTVIIDVGINKIGNKIYGDVHPDCIKKTNLISPVPGGVGPLTVAYLYSNLILN